MSSRILPMLSILPAVVFIAYGCANPAHIEQVNGTDLSRDKTYGWLQNKAGDSGHADLKNNIALHTIQEAVAKELQKTGWRYAAHRPDVLVSTDLILEKRRNNCRIQFIRNISPDILQPLYRQV